jgi:hypothetical protein
LPEVLTMAAVKNTTTETILLGHALVTVVVAQVSAEHK